MNSGLSQVSLSAIDEERFGIRTAKAPCVALDALPFIMDFCHVNNVTLLIARTLTSDLPVAQAMEREGFNLMDTLVYYACDLKKIPIASSTGDVLLRDIMPGEEEKVRIVAAEAFHGYFGHYHADPRLDRTKCDETYASWAVRSCLSHEVADQVLVAELEKDIVGFISLRLNNPEEEEGMLNCVAPKVQKKGIYPQVLIAGMHWGMSNGAKRMIISTQITNISVQKVWTHLGFEPSHSYYTFHKWFEK